MKKYINYQIELESVNNKQTKIEDDTLEGRAYAAEMQLLIEKFKTDLVLLKSV